MIKRVELPEAGLVRNLLDYDPTTGVFRWKTPALRSNMKIGDVAGRDDPCGYRSIKICGVHFKSHRLAWLLMTGEQPPVHIDHVNGNRADNRWSNLRRATQSENGGNSKVHSAKNSFKGVSRVGGSRTWVARITCQGKAKYLGSFDTPEQAHGAYKKAAVELFGEFARDA